MSVKIHNVPDELKSYKNWVVWKAETRGSKVTKVPYSPLTAKKVDVTNEAELGTFQNANFAWVMHQENGMQAYNGVGFVFNDSVPYTGIDLDDPNKFANSDYERAVQERIYSKFNSYSEVSPSGRGRHIIIRGKLPVKYGSGIRRNSVEVYSRGRYFTMTGDICNNVPIIERQELLEVLAGEAKPQYITHTGNSLERILSNQEIIERASKARNGELFDALYRGEWQSLGYQSQSEADFALVDIIAFYTDNKLQVLEIFRASGLGQRDKAQRADYCDSMINHAYDNKVVDIDYSQLKAKIEMGANINPVSIDGTASQAPVSSLDPPPDDDGTGATLFRRQWPSGMLGLIVKYIYDQSPRPIYDVALLSGLALVSAIAGRSYNVSSTGLSGYYLILASTGMGKEAAATGIHKLTGAVIEDGIGAMTKFVGPSDMRSGQGLLRYMAEQSNCFLSIIGEFGLRLRNTVDDRAPASEKELMKVLLSLYGSSGHGKLLPGTVYADSTKNTEMIRSPALTILGESTAETFYNVVDERVIENGLLPRFTVLEYKGPRPDANEQHSEVRIPQDVISWLCALVKSAADFNNNEQVYNIPATPEADQLLKQINQKYDELYNKDNSEVNRSLWSRCHLKTWKIAGTLAVSDNMTNPVITKENVEWADSLIYYTSKQILDKFSSGEVGGSVDESARVKEVKKLLTKYINLNIKESRLPKVAKHNNLSAMRQKQTITKRYINEALRTTKHFKTHKNGGIFAVNEIINTMVSDGILSRVPANTMRTEHGFHGEGYIINVD